jgi:ABC-type transport system involved in multi-copper enzyme maturation permease subunit
MEMLLAQPVRRGAVWVTQALATTSAAACLCGVLAVSVCGAVAFGPWAGKVEPQRFLLPVANVFGMMVCLAGIAACVSAADSYRWRTIGTMSGFYVFSLLAKLVGRMSGMFGWVGYVSFLNAYEPQRLVGDPATSWGNLLVYDGILLGIGFVAYVIGGIIFCRRDLPAPL